MKSFLRTNPTKIQDIDPSDVVIKIIRSPDFLVEKIFIEQVKMDTYRAKLPKQAEVYLIASSAFDERRICLGQIDSILVNREESLKDFSTDTVFFRLFVVDKNDPKILASCEKPHIIDELHSSTRGLFDTQYLDLGERLWGLTISENDDHKPKILIHNNPVLQLKSRIDQKDKFLQIMILPASFESVLFHLVINPPVEPGVKSWKKDWQEFCEREDIIIPYEDSTCGYTSDQIQSFLVWAKGATDKVFSTIKGVTHAMRDIEDRKK